MNVLRNKCPHCTFCANNKAVLKMHLKNFHQNQRTQPAIQEKVDLEIIYPKMYDNQMQQKCKCHICEEEFSPNELEFHFVENHQEPLNGIQVAHQCDLCENSYLLPAELKNHLKEVHTHQEYKRPIECNSCGKSFTRKFALKNHIKIIHEGQRNYKCEPCGKSFTSSG